MNQSNKYDYLQSSLLCFFMGGLFCAAFVQWAIEENESFQRVICAIAAVFCLAIGFFFGRNEWLHFTGERVDPPVEDDPPN
jgi:peptidoglycan/LPS O-acetylase OafA/YrhL